MGNRGSARWRFIRAEDLPTHEGAEVGPIHAGPAEATGGTHEDHGQRGHLLHVAYALYLHLQVSRVRTGHNLDFDSPIIQERELKFGLTSDSHARVEFNLGKKISSIKGCVSRFIISGWFGQIMNEYTLNISHCTDNYPPSFPALSMVLKTSASH